jgi:hypothetical protein
MFFDTPSVPAITGSITCFLTLAILVVCLRFRVRQKLRQGIQVDDWIALLGLLGVIGIASMLFAGLHTTSLGYPWIESEDPNYLTIILAIKVCFHDNTILSSTLAEMASYWQTLSSKCRPWSFSLSQMGSSSSVYYPSIAVFSSSTSRWATHAPCFLPV